MPFDLPADLEKRIVTEGQASLKRGRAVRRTVVVQPALVLCVMLVTLAVSGMSGTFVIAVMIAAASLCIIWAVMSVSASLNAQFDLLMTVLTYYGKRYER